MTATLTPAQQRLAAQLERNRAKANPVAVCGHCGGPAGNPDERDIESRRMCRKCGDEYMRRQRREALKEQAAKSGG